VNRLRKNSIHNNLKKKKPMVINLTNEDEKPLKKKIKEDYRR
jgi:hypothetical protein